MKTTVLTAPYRTNPIRKGDAVFDETRDYPKREVEDYRFAVENGEREEAVVVECVYELDVDEAPADQSRSLGFRSMNVCYKRNWPYARCQTALRRDVPDHPITKR